MQTADLDKLPLAERLQAMELLWESLSHDPQHEPSPAWHGQVLAARKLELERGQARPWDEARKDLQKLVAGGPP